MTSMEEKLVPLRKGKKVECLFSGKTNDLYEANDTLVYSLYYFFILFSAAVVCEKCP